MAAPAAVLQRLVHVGLRRLQGGNQSEDEGRGERDRHEQGKGPRVDRVVEPVRQHVRRNRGLNEPHAGRRKRQAGSPADRREHEALDQQLTNQPEAAGAERGSNRHLGRAMHRPRHHQVGDVGGRHEDHDEGRRDERHPAIKIAEQALVDGRHPRADVAIGVGMPGLEPLDDALNLGPGIGLGRLVLQPAKHLQVPAVSLQIGETWELSERQPDRGGAREARAIRDDPDNGGRRSVDQDRSAKNRWIAPVTVPPRVGAEHHNWCSAGAIFLRFGPASGEWRDADQRERVRREVRRVKAIGCAPFVANRDDASDVSRQSGERALFAANVLEVRERNQPVRRPIVEGRDRTAPDPAARSASHETCARRPS